MDVRDTAYFGCPEMIQKSNLGVSHISEQFLCYKQSSENVFYAKTSHIYPFDCVLLHQ